MAKPVVAVVGRPNVGKSTFFNFIAGKRISIVDDTPGITRDRVYAEAEWRGVTFTVIDTGGIEPKTSDSILKQMRIQAEIAVDTADVIIFMVDAKEGLAPSDGEIATMLRKANKPVVLTVNKVDKIGEPPPEIYEFYTLGIDNLVPISSSNGLGIGDLLDEVFERFPKLDEGGGEEDGIKIAVIGKPNTGKSSLINKILDEKRVIVSSIPGTTRDAIDTYVTRYGKKYIFIDTAGIRRKSRINEDIERYSIIRAFTAVDRADVCLIMMDSTEGPTEQDTKIAGYAHDAGKASIFVVNKWDLIDKDTGTYESYRKKVMNKFAFMSYAPVEFISAISGKRVEKLFDRINNVEGQSVKRVATGVLNDVLNDAMAISQPPSDKGKRLKIYYMTQVSIKPPAFVLFINNKELMHFSYLRYIENCLRDAFGFEGTPIRFMTRERREG